MVKLQAATVSNLVAKKRKRKAQDLSASQDVSATSGDSAAEGQIVATTTTTLPTKTHDGGKKHRRVAKPGANTPSLPRSGSSSIVESSIPWPPHFTRLAQTH